MSNMSHPDPAIVGTAEAAELLGVSVRTIHRMTAKGLISPTGKLPGPTGAYLFGRADVLDLARHLGRAA